MDSQYDIKECPGFYVDIHRDYPIKKPGWCSPGSFMFIIGLLCEVAE